MQGDGGCTTLDEVLDGIRWIITRARADGVTITYSKHAPPALVRRWANIVARRRQAEEDDDAPAQDDAEKIPAARAGDP
jgi:hypothetical protein